jgi:para-nitrobenzyl esterase
MWYSEVAMPEKFLKNSCNAAFLLKTRLCGIALLAATFVIPQVSHAQLRHVQQRTADGILEGVVSADGKVRTFKGIPYAAPPIGSLRWKAPQPVTSWSGVRDASEYGARCIQTHVYEDMIFPDPGPSEDCLYLNLWMPEMHSNAPLPVMVWIYGGGYHAGATSEPRQDGGNLCKKGVLVVSMNYRLGIFGFFSHPELARESGHNASGNYGLMDQVAALQWVKRNIAAFGGDPGNVTIFGESAGSFSVSALMASPLAKGLFHRAIGESGAFFSARRPPKTHTETEKTNVDFVKKSLGTDSLEVLRSKPAIEILEAASREGAPGFFGNIDGYFLPETPEAIFAAAKQNDVTLLAGWNADEGGYESIFEGEAPTRENYVKKVHDLYGPNTDAVLKLYPAKTTAERKRSAADLAGDRFIAFGTWKWMELQLKTGHAPVFRYRFDQALPLATEVEKSSDEEPEYKEKEVKVPRAPHAGEIEFVFQVLSSKDLRWRPDDCKVSDLMSSYWTNFAKTGDPNGKGLPHWPAYSKDGYQMMHITAEPYAAVDLHRDRYELLERIRKQKTTQ